MSYIKHMIELTVEAHENMMKTARAVPEGKLTWRVNDVGRSALDMVQEVATVPDIARYMVENMRAAVLAPEEIKGIREQRAQWVTLDKCEEEMNARLSKLYHAMNAFPENLLDTRIVLGYDSNRTYSMAHIMAYPYWNTTYHYGQINFIQTLLGDMQMHH